MDNSFNIIAWYPFEKNADILEIYNKSSIFNNIKQEINLKKTTINELKIEGQYDYITLIGTYEYAPTIIKGEKPYSTFLKILKEHLKPGRKITISC